LNDAIHNQGLLLVGEVQDSIAGNRAEPTSVDTGKFLNSVPNDSNFDIDFVSIVASNVPYANVLEDKRKHFSNSSKRKEQSILNALQLAVR